MKFSNLKFELVMMMKETGSSVFFFTLTQAGQVYYCVERKLACVIQGEVGESLPHAIECKNAKLPVYKHHSYN